MTFTFAKDLNPEQLAAVTHRDGPLLVLAGAGSGKTRIVTYRIGHLIESGVSPSQILALTFTNKAAKEMQERIHVLFQKSNLSQRPIICTFHSLGVRILRESIHHLGYKNDFVIYDEDDSDKLLKMSVQSLGMKAEDIKAVRSLISHAKNQLQNPGDLDVSHLAAPFQAQFGQIYSFYQEKLKEANAVDFDDLLYLTVRLFREKPEVLEQYQKRWPYLLIDEYQDTNHSQYLIGSLIVEKSQNLFVVGDPDQSIYSWRGANIHNILNFERDYKNAKVVRLEQNYRSRKNILDAANALIENNQGRYKKNLWSDRGAGEKISLFVGSSDREEAEFIVSEIDRLNRHYNIPLKEMAIFYRTNFQSRTFEDFLLRRRIPYIIVGGISFYHRKEIKDILSFLHMVHSDHDTIAFSRTINLPKRGIGEATVEKIRAVASSQSVPLLEYANQMISGEAEGLKLSQKQREGLKEYVTLIENLRMVETEASMQKLVIETIRQSRYYDFLREEKETFEDRKANLEDLISKAAEWDLLNENPTLGGFLEELTLKNSVDDLNQTTDVVHLMTIHNGKGLEFTAAFIGGMEEDLFPHANSRGKYEAVEEERRLCYVGMTRAKEHLYLTAAETRFLWGNLRTMRPSRFLREIPKEYMQRIG